MSKDHQHHHQHGVVDRSSWSSAEGLRAVKISTLGLAGTAAIQFVIVGIGGSVALLADGLHNFGDVFTTVGLWVAFIASRRAADRRYTYGYDRFEDLAGVVIVVIIAASAALAGYESLRALARPRQVTALGASMAAALVGFVGNEVVARYKIQVGRRISSVGLQADGIHSRTDGFVSLGAFVGLVGVAFGYAKADPAAGLAITAAIVWVTVTTARDVIARLVDAVDPEIVDVVKRCARSVKDVMDVHDVAARWAGRSLYVQLHVAVPEDLPLHEAHGVGEEVRHAVLHDIEGVSQVIVHLDPWGEGKHQSVYHTATAHHFPEAERAGHHHHDHD
ncbi:MAG: cation diffusion facilitator family transporter [Actinomycetota bacterium]